MPGFLLLPSCTGVVHLLQSISNMIHYYINQSPGLPEGSHLGLCYGMGRWITYPSPGIMQSSFPAHLLPDLWQPLTSPAPWLCFFHVIWSESQSAACSDWLLSLSNALKSLNAFSWTNTLFCFSSSFLFFRRNVLL
jgi:hypothetical protein